MSEEPYIKIRLSWLKPLIAPIITAILASLGTIKLQGPGEETTLNTVRSVSSEGSLVELINEVAALERRIGKLENQP